jgi:hypothetical protein
MPRKTLQLAGWYATIGTLCASAVLALTARAAELTPNAAGEGFSALAERFGIWAALTVLLVAGAVYGLYRQSVFQTTTLVGLIRDVTRCIDRNTAALGDAPCGRQQARQQGTDKQTGQDGCRLEPCPRGGRGRAASRPPAAATIATGGGNGRRTWPLIRCASCASRPAAWCRPR